MTTLAEKLGGGGTTLAQKLSVPAVQPSKSLYQKFLDVTGSIGQGFSDVTGASTIGKGIGTALATGNEYLRGQPQIAQNIAKSGPTIPQQIGGYGQAALTVVSPEVGNGASLLGRIGANTALGAGLGGAQSLAKGNAAGQIAKDTAIGGVTGAAVSGVAEGTSALLKNLPNWLTKAALPKLDKENIPYALQNTKIGLLPEIQKKSEASLANYESQVQGVLAHPEYQQTVGSSNAILGHAMQQFPHSEYSVNDLIKNAQSIAPKVASLITKFEKGEANVGEINLIRKELDSATKSVYTSLNRPPEAKLLGAALSNAMREFVQTTAPETKPIFQNYTKEIGLKKAIDAAIKKGQFRPGLTDLAAGYAGFEHAGLTGMLEAIIAERFARSPTVQLGAAHLIGGGVSKLGSTANAAFQGIKAPLISGIGSSVSPGQ